MDTDKIREFNKPQIERKFYALVKGLLDAIARKNQGEIDCYRKMVDSWKERFNFLSEEEARNTEREVKYQSIVLNALFELETETRCPTWFKVLSSLLRNTFGVGTVLVTNEGTKVIVVGDNEETLKEVEEMFYSLQEQMFEFANADKTISNRPNYYTGFMTGAYHQIHQQNNVALVLKSKIDKAIEWYAKQSSGVRKTAKSKVKQTRDFQLGFHDGQNRSERLNAPNGASAIGLLGA